VTAACLAESGFEVIGVDPDAAVVEALEHGQAPVSEPGLDDLLAEGMRSGRLRFTTDARALSAANQVWVTFDTPVDDDDRADVEWVLSSAEQLLAPLASGTLVIVSSQLPVGSVAELERRVRMARSGAALRFACVPENLRLGQALEAFRRPERIVAGVRSDADRSELAVALARFTDSVEWMRVESAEMTKHALNGFLATSVAFINEVAAVCEQVGADAAEVSRGLKSEPRIGPHAYLAPGDAFSGGTLARDVAFMCELATRHGLSSHVFRGVAEGNDAHKRWSRRRLVELLGQGVGETPSLAGSTVAVWGLTYKPGTDTLRRSGALELCHWLASAGAAVRTHDPAAAALPADTPPAVERFSEALEAAAGADALVLATPWPEYRAVSAADLRAAMRAPIVLDAVGFLAGSLDRAPGIGYVRVGSGSDAAAALGGR
jgi:UDPglucose 6-dehydrogenase